jgi:hypothetical protein
MTHFTRLFKVTLGSFVAHFCFAFLAADELFIYSPLKQLVYFSILESVAATMTLINIRNCVANIKTRRGVKQGCNLVFRELAHLKVFLQIGFVAKILVEFIVDVVNVTAIVVDAAFPEANGTIYKTGSFFFVQSNSIHFI